MKKYTVEKPSGIEVNGPSNCLMYLDVMKSKGSISEQDYNLLKEELEKTIRYMQALKNPDGVSYYEFTKKKEEGSK